MKTPVPCPRCLRLAFASAIRVETVQPLPEGAMAPLSRERYKGKAEPCCFDCAAADCLVALFNTEPRSQTIQSAFWRANKRPISLEDLPFSFTMARVCVGNDRQEQYRLPGVPMGLVAEGLVRPSAEGDLEKHHKWLRKVGLADREDLR